VLERIVRAGNPRPGAWMVVGGRRLRVLRALAFDAEGDAGTITRRGELGTSAGSLRLDEVQAEGRRPMTGQAWRAGQHEPLVVVDHA
jgi:methionyl-tRNA formyltransferase